MSKVREVMTSGAEVVSPDDTVKHAAVKMEALGIGPLPVCDGERLVGVLTDRDITVRIVASGRDPNNTPVREAMTAEIAYCFEDQDTKDAARIMKDRDIRRLPVLNKSKRLVGIVSLGDLAASGEGKGMAGEVLEDVTRSEPQR
jgi:CBS domain-containing protein